jgi:predicted rRNA methylase YqxC with S4 and FtsJ domains
VVTADGVYLAGLAPASHGILTAGYGRASRAAEGAAEAAAADKAAEKATADGKKEGAAGAAAAATAVVCRAYYKLREAVRRSGQTLPLPPGTVALDVGASPGGWSEFLARACQVCVLALVQQK